MKRFLISVGLLAVMSNGNAAPIDLSSWTAVTLDFAGGQAAANWVLQPGNTAVVQTLNADPSFYLNNINQTSYSIDGSFSVLPSAGDDDFIGFVFGYQNSSNFYLFDWKGIAQNSYGGSAAEGMTIKRLTGATGDGLVDLSLAELWENQADLGDMTVLAQNHGATAGWAANTVYDFHLDFNLTPNEIHILVRQGSTNLWDVTVSDPTFSSGQFGFYNYSQAQVSYAGFEQTGGVPAIPVPAALPLLLSGVAGLGWVANRRKKAAV